VNITYKFPSVAYKHIRGSSRWQTNILVSNFKLAFAQGKICLIGYTDCEGKGFEECGETGFFNYI
jgi:hypothetical protein